VTAALNHLDLWVRRRIPGVELEMPHVLGADGAGVVDAVGPGVEGPSPGHPVYLQPGLFCGRCEFCLQGEESLCIRYRLLGEHVDGTLAEHVVVPAVNVYRKPHGLDWEKAAALQIARYAGANVYVTSSSRAKLDRALALGADVAIDYTIEDVPARIRELTEKRGVDLVVDNVGEATWRQSLECVRRGGRIATCGATTGSQGVTPINRVFWKQISIRGTTMANRREFDVVSRLVIGGRIDPVIDRVMPLEEVPLALARLESGQQFGKIVIRIAEDPEAGSGR
jgi:NADPH:quinone reductase-like Zn-dependent oxidoreductase